MVDEKQFIVPLGKDNDLNKILINHLKCITSEVNICDYLSNNLDEIGLVRIYLNSKPHLSTTTLYVLMPDIGTDGHIAEIINQLKKEEPTIDKLPDDIKSYNDIKAHLHSLQPAEN